MTAKRFRLGYVCGDYGLIDDDGWIDLHSMSENSEKNIQICINKMNELADENEELKKALLFFYDVANCECSTNWKGDMEKGCKRFFNCTYEEAKSKYGNYDGMWWEIND